MSPFLYPHLLSLSLVPPHPPPGAQDCTPFFSSSPLSCWHVDPIGPGFPGGLGGSQLVALPYCSKSGEHQVCRKTR